MAEENVIETVNLTKKYNGHVVVDSVTFTIKKGEIYGLLGPNGAGKTTIVLMLLGLTEPTSGYCKVYGFNPVKEPLKVKRIIGYLPEKIGFYEDLTAEQNLKFITELNNINTEEAEKRIREALEKVGLNEYRKMKVSKFSRGMKQRLGIASVLVKKPKVAFLDELTQGLDPKWINKTLDLFSSLSKEKEVTILLSSHLLHQVQRVCHRVGIIKNGKIVVQGTIDELRKIGGYSWIIEANVQKTKEKLVKKISEIEGVEKVKVTGETLIIESNRDLRPEISKAIIEDGTPLLGLKAREVSLNEIYMKYFKEA